MFLDVLSRFIVFIVSLCCRRRPGGFNIYRIPNYRITEFGKYADFMFYCIFTIFVVIFVLFCYLWRPGGGRGGNIYRIPNYRITEFVKYAYFMFFCIFNIFAVIFVYSYCCRRPWDALGKLSLRLAVICRIWI